jgi:hypothetical protein
MLEWEGQEIHTLLWKKFLKRVSNLAKNVSYIWSLLCFIIILWVKGKVVPVLN